MNFADFTPEQQELLLTCESPEEARALILSGEFALTDEQLEEVAGGADWIIESGIWAEILKRA